MTIVNIALIAALIVYSIAGGAFAFNLMGVSDRAAQHYRNYPWLFRQIGRDNPLAWRSGGLIMLVTGVLLLGWLIASAIGQVPTVNQYAGAAILVGVAVAMLAATIALRLRQR